MHDGSIRCTAISKTTGQRCERTTKTGVVCYMHGNNPPTKLKAARFSAVDEVAKLYDPDSPPVTDPFAELARLGGIARNAMNVAGKKVNELEGRWHDTDDDGRRTLKTEIQLWMQLVKFSESVLANLAKLGLEDRMVRIEEARAAALIRCLEVALAAVPLEASQRQAIEAAYDAELERLVVAGVVLESVDAG